MRIVFVYLAFLLCVQTNLMGQIYNYQDDSASKSFWKSALVQAKSSSVFFSTDGPGVINKLWLTTFPSNKKEDMELANHLILNIYWDASIKAAVSVPLADFFCQPLKLQEIENHFFNASNNQLLFNTTIPMPFRQNARFEIINNSDKEIELFYGIDLEFKAIDKDAMYLHAYWQHFDNLASDKPFLLVPQLKGKGRYLGTHVSLVQNEVLDNWPWYTRPITILLDAKADDDNPSLYIKTLDDFFGSGWWDREEHHNTYTHEYSGRPLVVLDDADKLSIALYKYHVQDPLWFKESISIEIGENWDWGNQKIGAGNWATTSFFYLSEPESEWSGAN